MATLTQDQITKISTLAKLSIRDDELVNYTKDMTNILTLVDQIQSIDVVNVSPTARVTGLKNVSREDAVTPATVLSQSDALKNAKSTYQGYIKTKAIFD